LSYGVKIITGQFWTFATISALTAICCGAQNSVAIGATADMTGLEAAGGSIENDPLRKSGSQNCCNAQHGSFSKMW
jgi:hypothetical protein